MNLTFEEFQVWSKNRAQEAKRLILRALDGQIPRGYIISDAKDQMFQNALFRIKPEKVVEGSKSIHFIHHLTYRAVSKGVFLPSEEWITVSCDTFNGSVWVSDEEFGIEGRIKGVVLGLQPICLVDGVREAVSMTLTQTPFAEYKWNRDEHDPHKHHLFANGKKMQSVWKSYSRWGTSFGAICETFGNAKVRALGAAMGAIKTLHDERLAGLGDSE